MSSSWPVNAAGRSAGAVANLALDRPGKSNALNDDSFREIPAVRHEIPFSCFIWRFASPDVSSMTIAQRATIAGTQVDRGATRRPRRHSQRQRPLFLCRFAHFAG